ncbi:MAG TPA: sulfurtransferase [Verrucomicrobiae bacterium]|nr:sulfurtransferase [Verrucomicrobiae bacterium]
MHATLVDVATLAEHLDDPRWVVVDCRHTLADFSAGRREYESAHIPGAFFADVETDLAGVHTGTNGRHPLPGRDDFVALLRRMGVSGDTQLIAYDAGADMFAARLWFLARWVGHRAVAVLDGGWKAWCDADAPGTADVTPKPPHRGTIAAFAPLDGTVNAAAVSRAIGSDDMLLLDARAPERYAGEVEPIDPVAGHIPGARNRWFKSNYDDRGFWKSPERLNAELGAFGESSRVVNYCGSGVSAAVNALAFEIAGLSGARLYPGSWSEWCSTPREVERF